MPLSATLNSTHTALQVTWTIATTTTPLNLTGATITGTIRRVSNGATRPIAGTCVATDAPNGVFAWQYAAADTAESGVFSVTFAASYGDGVEHSLSQYWTVYD